MKPQIKIIDHIIAIGIEANFISSASKDFNGPSVIAPLWQNFNERRHEITNLSSNRSFGVTFPYWPGKTTKEHEMVYVACAEVANKNEVPKNMLAVEVPEGKYAVFTYKGKLNLNNISEVFNNIYTKLLPSSGLVMRDAPHLEIYDERFKFDSDDSEFDICVPVS